MKKVFWIVWSVVCIFFLCLTITYIKNEKMITEYHKGTADESMVPKFSLTQPYVIPFNKGDIAYQNGEYDKAIQYYQDALQKMRKPKYGKECLMHINMALAKVAPYVDQVIAEEDYDDAIEKIDQACAYLLENGCANENGFGHNFDAQTLYNELLQNKEDLEKQREQEKQADGQSDEQNQKDESQNQPEEKENIEESKPVSPDEMEGINPEEESPVNPEDVLEDYLEKQFGDMQKQGELERDQKLDNYASWGNYSFSTGKNW